MQGLGFCACGDPVYLEFNVAIKIFPMDKQPDTVPLAVLSEKPAEDRDHDAFFLQHLHSVKADGAWYLNQHFIGKGGNGTTFFVTCTSGVNVGVQFALKVFHRISDDKRRERFLDEVRHYKTLSHPSIIKVYDEGTFKVRDKLTGKVREYPFAIVDYVLSNLEVKLGRGLPKITRLDAVRHIFNITSGVSYLHSQAQPIVHRDIKPSNILVSEHDARLGDLGLARVLMSDEKDENSVDVASYIAMPWFYRTPELVRIARGEKVKLTVASDIYQLGLVLYRSVTGFNSQMPPENDALDDIELDVRPIQGVCGIRLKLLIEQMLNEAPEERPNADEVLQRLSVIHKEICEADFTATGIMR
jgi:serine/threonine protein kinase